ncbi:MAG: YCF48-related protein [Pirellulaceae bacterium]
MMHQPCLFAALIMACLLADAPRLWSQNSSLQRKIGQLQAIPDERNLPPRKETSEPLQHAPWVDGMLRSVCIQSLDRGWAVGDRGTILATTDGGRQWSAQVSGTSHPLLAVTFHDDRSGWAVGGAIEPPLKISRGVLLRTSNGGKTWQSVSIPTLPRLTGIQSLGPGHLIAWGDYSTVHQSSIFESLDGGEHWSVACIGLGHLQQAHWRHRTQGLLLDRIGRLFHADQTREVTQLVISPLQEPRRWHCLADSGTQWWIAGEKGHIAFSQDGLQWTAIDRSRLPEACDAIEWRAIHADGRSVWCLGQPGNVLIHSADQGSTWQLQTLPISLPLETMAGWQGDRLVVAGAAAGIVGSRNGGQAWWSEHGEERRLGLLAITATGATAPLELLAETSIELPLRSGWLRVADVDRASAAAAWADESSTQSQIASSLALAWAGHLDASASLATPPHLTSASGNPPQVEQLAAWIRTLRPQVLVAEQETATGLPSQVATWTQDALKLAADPMWLADPKSNTLLNQPWQIAKVFVPSDHPGGLAVPQEKALAHSGLLLSQLLAPVDLLVRPVGGSAPASTYSLRSSPIFSEGSRRNLLGGLAVDPATQRPPFSVGQRSVARLAGGIQTRSQLLALCDLPNESTGRQPRWESTLESILQTAPQELHGRWLMELAERCRQRGQWNRWEATLGRLVRIDPNSGLAFAAWIELATHAGSEELAYWIDRQSVDQLANRNSLPPVRTVNHDSPFRNQTAPSTTGSSIAIDSAAPSDGVKEAAFQADEGTLESTSPMAQGRQGEAKAAVRAADWKEKREAAIPGATWLVEPRVIPWSTELISRTYSPFFSDPRAGMARWRVARWQQGQIKLDASSSQEASPLPHTSSPFQEWLQAPAIAGWYQIAQQETQWNQGILHPLAMVAAPTSLPPQLDGLAEEPCWNPQGARELISADGQASHPSAQVRLAYDDQFLYAWMVAPTPTADLPPAPQPTRQYDSLAPSLDHFTLTLDIDRDYSTCYQFKIDFQGNTEDRCCNLIGWNPKWFRAVHQGEATWSVELAIPWSELTARPPGPQDAWAAHAMLTLPSGKTWHNGRIASESFQPHAMRLLHFGREEEK